MPRERGTRTREQVVWTKTVNSRQLAVDRGIQRGGFGALEFVQSFGIVCWPTDSERPDSPRLVCELGLEYSLVPTESHDAT